MYVGNLQEDITKDMLNEVFKGYGDIVDIWIARNPPGELLMGILY